MTPHFQTALSEEQMAAYLDGMLSADESCIVESTIDSYPELQEIQEAMDEVDASYIAYDATDEIPVECLSDDFTLPHIGIDYVEEDYTDDDNDGTATPAFRDEYHQLEDAQDNTDDYDDGSFEYQDFFS